MGLREAGESGRLVHCPSGEVMEAAGARGSAGETKESWPGDEETCARLWPQGVI